jgi:hypothetical protein
MSFHTIFVMVIIQPSSGLAPLCSVMICWNIVATTVNMSFTDELFALGIWTDWLGTCWLCLKGGVAGPCNEDGWGCCTCRVFLRNAPAELRQCVFFFATFHFASLPLRACSLDSWRDEVTLRPPTCSCSMSVSDAHFNNVHTPVV